MTVIDLVVATPGRDARERVIAPTDALKSLLPRLQRHWDAAARETSRLEAEVVGLISAVDRANAALGVQSVADRLVAFHRE